MPTYRLKKSLNTTVDKRKRSIRGKARGSNDIDSDGEPFMRVKSRDDRAHSRLNRQGSFDSKNRKGGDDDGYRKSFTREDNHGFRDAPVGRKVINSNAGIPGKKPFYEKQRKFEEDGSGREKGRSDVEGRGDSMGVKGRKRDDDYGRESRRSSGEDYALRAPHWKKDDDHGGRDSRRIEGRKLSVRGRGDNMGFKGRKSDDDSGRESQRSSGEAYAPRGSHWKKDGDHGGGDSCRSVGRKFSVRGRGDNIGFKGRKRDGKEIKLEEDGSGVENRSNGEARAERQSRWKEDDDRGGRDSYRSGGRELSVRARVDKLGLRGKNRDGKQIKHEEDDSEIEKQSNGEAHAPRYHRGNKDDDHGVQDSPRSEGRDLRLESRADMVEVKGKKRDGIRSNDKREGDAVAKFSGKNAKGQGRLDQIDVERLDKRQAQWLDKSGKKLDSHKKASNDSTPETDAPPRKRKRIKLDRYDFSNKRMDDGISSDEKDEKDEKDADKEIKISQNAQFRAISPSPSILSFIEDNLLGRRRLIELQKAGYNTKLSAPLDNIPFSTCTDRERIEENVFRNKLEFFAAAKISSSFPPPVIPEIAFAGRSNVGKSSLLNALTRQWGVVRTSDKPGHTQSINFFRLASKLCLVDLPGYGFAYAKEEVKDSWEELVKEYVSTRVGLQRVCLLIDTKWGMKPRDNELIDLMERSQTPYQIVLTKTDVVFPIDVARRAMQIQKNLKANKSVVNPVMMVSSQSGAGIRSMRSVLSKLSRFIKP